MPMRGVVQGKETRAKTQEPHQLNLASQSKVDGLVTVVAAVVVAAAAKGQQASSTRQRQTEKRRETEI